MRTGCLSNTDPLSFGVEFAYWPPLKTWKKEKRRGRIDNGEVKERKGEKGKEKERKRKGKKW